MRSDLILRADVLVRVPNSPLIPGIGRNLILYNIYNATGRVAGSQPILDSKNSTGSPWSVNVQRPQGMPPFATGMQIQVIGCSLSTSTGQASVDGTTNQLLDAPSPLNGASANSTWEDWQPDLTKSNLCVPLLIVPDDGAYNLTGWKTCGRPCSCRTAQSVFGTTSLNRLTPNGLASTTFPRTAARTRHGTSTSWSRCTRVVIFL